MTNAQTVKGALCLVVSAFGFAVMGLCVRLTDDYGVPVSAFQKSFFRNLVAFAIAGMMFMPMSKHENAFLPNMPRTRRKPYFRKTCK